MTADWVDQNLSDMQTYDLKQALELPQRPQDGDGGAESEERRSYDEQAEWLLQQPNARQEIAWALKAEHDNGMRLGREMAPRDEDKQKTLKPRQY